jgi:hypothetical protein
MIYLISHRGNINGRIEEAENRPDYIDDAIRLGYDVEIDIWVKNDILYLGHDVPQYEIPLEWLLHRKGRLWVHCKNVDAMEYIYDTDLNYFWHDTDTMTLTSKGHIWAYPGRQPIRKSIAVMPELKYMLTGVKEDLSVCSGICSDYIQKYK